MENPPTIRKRWQPRPGHVRGVAERDLIDEIAAAARLIADARDPYDEPVYRTDGVWRVISTIERSHYCLAIADLARAMRLSRQAAQKLAHAAERAGVIELAPNHDDKRILQAFLTPIGRSRLKAGRHTESIWLATLLNGLGDNELAATTRVVTVVRQRLERDARELAQRKAQELAQRKARELAQRNAGELAQRNAGELAQRNARDLAQRDVPSECMSSVA